MFKQPMFEIFDGPISSPALRDGSLPCSSPDGRAIGRSGRGLVPVSPSRQPANGKGSKTSGISGPSSSDSSKLSDRLASSVNRLLAEAGLNGLMEYRQTWKKQATPLGRSIWAHTASGRRTSDSGCSGAPSEAAGWPTPAANEFECNPDKTLARRKECKERTGNGNGFGLTLGQIVHTTGWNTPRATDGSNGGPNQAGGALPADAALAGRATPMAATPGAGNCDYSRSVEAAMGLRPGKNEPLAGWATPAARDFKSGETADGNPLTYNARPLSEQVLGATTASSPASTERRGVLDAAFSRWLMGFPETWDEMSPNYDAWRSVQERIASGG